MKEKKISLRYGYLIAAAFFLFNPNANILDLLPDCFGYLLLCVGIRGLDEIAPRFEDARRGFIKLFWLTLSRIPMFFIMSGMTHGDNALGILITLLALSYGIVELMWLIPAFSAFFGGLEYLGERFGAFSLCDRYMETARTSAYIALIAKPILAFFPELTYLDTETSLGDVTYRVPLVEFRSSLILVSCAIGLVLGIVFFACFLRYLHHAKKDTAIPALLSAAYQEREKPIVAANTLRRLSFAFGLLAAGVCCMIDMVFDRINYLPDILGVILILWATALLVRYTKRAIPVLVAGSVWAVCSGVLYHLRAEFFAKYSYEALDKSGAAMRLYEAGIWASAAETAVAALTLVLLALMLFTVIKEHTGYHADNINNYTSHLSLHAALNRKTVCFTALGLLAAGAGFFEVYSGRFTQYFELGTPTEGVIEGIGSGVVHPVFGWAWLLTWILSAAWFVYALHFTSVLREEATQKYILE